jgi:hypothetical protein
MTYTITQMATLYNEITGSDVKKFASKSKGEARLDAACDERNLVWADAEDGSGLYTYTPDDVMDDMPPADSDAWNENRVAKEYTPEELELLGQFGLGADHDTALCPHCGINHCDNGHSMHGDGAEHETSKWACLGCNGEWGELIAKRATSTRAVHADDAKITKVEANPKREGTKAHARFALYKKGMTVREALEAGVTRQDLRWDTERKLVVIG